MSWTFICCVVVSFAWLGLFFLFGKFFLTIIHAEKDVASSIVFGYLLLQLLYQIVYLPFYALRGSYRTVSFLWMGIVVIILFPMIICFRKIPTKNKRKLSNKEKISIIIAGLLILFLACYIALHVPLYGADTIEYISRMNEFYYRDTMWVDSGKLSFHFGMCSMFEFFTISSLLTGIKPYYISLFTVRMVGIFLFSLSVFRTGSIVFKNKNGNLCWLAVILAVLVPWLLMFWGSYYTAEFFYWRINEAKGFCQFVLLPVGFSVYLEMLRKESDREFLWKEQLLVGLAAVPVSASSLTPYMFLVLLGMSSMLAYDKFKKGWQTIRYSVYCVLPNLIYLLIYIFDSKSIV